MKLLISFFTLHLQHSLIWRHPRLLKESKCCFRNLGTLSQFSSHSSSFKGRFWGLFHSTKTSLMLSVQLFCFSSTVTARTSGSSTRSRSRRGTPGTPPAPYGWAAGCRRGRPWRQRWTSRRMPSPPPAARRS